MARATTIKFQIENLDEFIANLEAMERRANDGMEAALRDEAGRTMRRAEGEVPQLTGKLKGSGFVGIPSRWANGMEIRFGFGTPYALYQHYGNYKHDDGKQMFLADPVKWSRRGLSARVRAVLVRYF